MTPGRLRRVGRGVFFQDRQRVHVEAEHHRGRVRGCIVTLDDGDDAGLADAGGHLQPQAAQVVGDDAGRAHFVEAQLRVLVRACQRITSVAEPRP
jgi:hypothetical protein